MSIDLGLYKIDIEKVVRYFKQDIKDDWFQDPLLYEDLLDKKKIIEYFKSNIQRNHGIYIPVGRQILNIPKKGGALRYSLETSFYDRIAYHSFGITLIEKFDELINPRVFSHRFDNYSKHKRYLFLNSIEQWSKFEEYVRVDAKDKTVMQTDIQNYFENIRIADLKTVLLSFLQRTEASSDEKAKLRFCIDSICRCLESWTYNGINGLPQNRDISSFLANIYMLPVDSYMYESNYDFYRYMDDIRVLCKDKHEARSILKNTIIELRKIGLNINSSKTKTLEPGTKEHVSFLSRDSLKLDRINTLINSGKKYSVALGFLESKKELEMIQEKKEYASRAFRFFIKRIAKIALCKDIKVPDSFFEKISADIVENIGEVPDVADQFFSYLAAVEISTQLLSKLEKFLLDPEKSIYSWQNYFLWKLFALKCHNKSKLLNYAKKSIINSKKQACVAGAVLYLGKCGRETHKEWIVKNFKYFDDFFTQRHAIIAIQELQYNKFIKDDVQPYIDHECKGMYSTLNNYREPLYIIPPTPVKYSELIREVSFYG